MERQRLIRLIESKGTSSKEETNELWDIVRTFPYFQTARLLLAKSFHKQSSIHFHNELKTAAAYASDRKALSRLINDETTRQNTEEESNVFVIQQKETVGEAPVLKSSESYSENQFALSSESEEDIETPAFEIKEESPVFNKNKTEAIKIEAKYREEQEEQKEKIIEEKKSAPELITTASDEPATSNEEIIRRRLNEILSGNKPAEAPPVPQRGEDIPNETSVLLPPLGGGGASLDELPSQPVDAIEGLEIETIIEENYLQELEKLPEISPKNEESISTQTSVPIPPLEDRRTVSFIDWLKQKNGGHTTLEEVKDEPFPSDDNRKDEVTSPPSGDRGALIDKFIATTPRIVPVKTEFYSPANMARQSIIDNEDIISETLARIYFDQGNYPKARSCYERLSLLYPEKSASFAPLIEKIDEIIAGSG